MPITYENYRDVIINALEKIISFIRDNQYIFLAQSIWWISSFIGLQKGLVTHINNLNTRSEVHLHANERLSLVSDSRPPAKDSSIPIVTSTHEREVLAKHLNIQGNPRSSKEPGYIHPYRMSQINDTIHNVSDIEHIDLRPYQLSRVVESAKQFVHKSRKERTALKMQKEILSRTKSGKIPTKPLFQKQRNYLQSIPKPTIAEYLDTRK